MAERALTYERALAYDPRFDYLAYQDLGRQKSQLSLEEYQRRLNQLNLRTRHNLVTSLGERFNVELTQITYHLENDQLVNSEHDEPFLDIVRRGQQYRLKYGNPNDHRREAAEVGNFERIQQFFVDLNKDEKPERHPKIISISARGSTGSDYQHNFFDLYEKQTDGTTKMSRFTSKFTYQQFLKATQELNPNLPTPIQLSDEYFFNHPIETELDLKEILSIFHPDRDTMLHEEFQKLVNACTPLILNYIKALLNNRSLDQIRKIYRTLLNFADTKPHLKTNQIAKHVQTLIDRYGDIPIRPVMTSCGLQGDPYSPYSVAEFGMDSCPDCRGGSANHFHCPKNAGGCGGKILSGLGLTRCPHCGLTKEQAGSLCT